LRNKVEFKFFGMRRSGNHAILHWIACHFDTPCCLVNDISDFGNPSAPAKDDINASELKCFKAAYGSDDFWKDDKEVLIQTYEDYDLSDLDWEGNLKVVGDSESEKMVLVVRDPYNLMSSRIAKRSPHLIDVGRFSIERWKQHAKEALSDTQYIWDTLVVVDYNRWVVDERYRRELEDKLELGCQTDEGINRVVMAGSSFSKRGKDGCAQEMKVMDRWKFFKDSSKYLSLFDRRTVELAERLGYECPWGGVK